MNKKNGNSVRARKVPVQSILAVILMMASVVGRAGAADSITPFSSTYPELSLSEASFSDASFPEASFSEVGVPATSRVSLSDDAWADSDFRGRIRPSGLGSLLARCESCEVHLGVGGTYHSFKGTRGVVLPLSVTWHENRYEFGIYRFASTQSSDDNDEHTERLVARPYWGASLSRRFALIERGPISAFFGFGVSYKTEQDILSITHWNFASQLGVRFQSPRLPAVFEFSARHWSNGGVRTPNRGQDFAVLTVRFDR